MIEQKRVKPIPNEFLDEIGFTWHTDEDGTPYVSDRIVVLKQDEAEEYHEAGLELYKMFTETGQDVIDNSLYDKLGINPKFIPLIEESWDKDHWHLYGRFDLAGGIDDKPIKLIEFNADTPTSLFETAIIQYELLKHSNMNDDYQFNTLSANLVENFKRLITKSESTVCDTKSKSILFSSVCENDEDEITVRLMQEMAVEAGFTTEFKYMHEVQFDDEGVYDTDSDDRVAYDYWFKLFPWEDLIDDEPELLDLLLEMYSNPDRKTEIVNPPYSLVFQSKGLLPIMSDKYPNHPLLLKSSFEPLKGVKQVKKVNFGREGANVTIIEKDGSLGNSNDGEYGHRDHIYQEFVPFPKDQTGDSFQAGLFFINEPCAIAFRKGGDILGDTAKFVGHVIAH